MSNVLNIIQIILSVLLVTVILFQQRGTGLGGAFGAGGGGTYRSKRGVEKFLLYATIVLAILFAAAAIVNLFL